MRKCRYCGSQNDDDSLFCSECGKKMHQGRVCPYCGSSISDDDVFCQNCGKILDEHNNESSTSTSSLRSQRIYPNCGTFQSGDTHINTNKKEITIGRSASCDISLGESAEFASTCHGTIFWNGTQLMYKDTSTNGTVINDMLIHGKTVPINHGDTILIAGKYQISWRQIDSLMSPSNISFQQTRLLKSHAPICRTCGTQLNDGAGYCPSCGQSYNTVSGNFGFVLCDNDGNELETDKLHWGYFLLCFLIPIVGFIYALSIRKKKPATSNQALMASLLGFVVSLILSYFMPMAISRYNEIKEAKLAREKFVKDSLEQVKLDSLYLVAQKEKEELETKRYEEFKKKFTFTNILALLGNYDKVPFAQKCGLELIYKEIDNDGEITCEEYVYGYDIEKGDKKDSGYEIVAKSNHACYLIYNLDSGTYSSMCFKDSSDAENFQEQAKEYGLLVLDGSMYVPKTKMESGYHYVDSLDWSGDYDPVYTISQTERQNGWYRVFIGIDF